MMTIDCSGWIKQDDILPKELASNKKRFESYLKTRDYDDNNLYDYCINHP